MNTCANILVVEDEQIVAKDLEFNLKRMGYDVPATAATGEEAVQKADMIRPDLVFMDIHLHGSMDGIEAARRIQQRRSVPVIYLSAYADDDTVARAMETAPYGYLLKPFQMHQLRTSVRMALHRHQVEERLRDSEAHNAAIVATSLDCIITVDYRGCIVEFNPAAERTFGRKRAQVLGRPLVETVIPPAHRGKHIEDWTRYLLTGQGPFLGKRLELTALRADGTEFPVELTLTRISQIGPPLFTAHLRDITERRLADQESAKLIRDLRLALEQVKTLSGLIPICTTCKKIRDDGGYWHQVEAYLSARSAASFTHSYCPDCAQKFREEFFRLVESTTEDSGGTSQVVAEAPHNTARTVKLRF